VKEFNGKTKLLRENYEAEAEPILNTIAESEERIDAIKQEKEVVQKAKQDRFQDSEKLRKQLAELEQGMSTQ
jgi:predicted nuclease with TOPRIM domain